MHFLLIPAISSINKIKPVSLRRGGFFAVAKKRARKFADALFEKGKENFNLFVFLVHSVTNTQFVGDISVFTRFCTQLLADIRHIHLQLFGAAGI